MASENFLAKYKTQWSQNSSAPQMYTTTYEPANEVLTKAGPTYVYQRPGYRSEISDVTKVTTEITHQPATTHTVQYRINEDPDPVRMVRPNGSVTQRQNIKVRYLEPPELPSPAPVIVKERQLTPPPPAPPIVIRQLAPAPPTPPPLVIRERPPQAPSVITQPTVVEKLIPPPTPPPRQVIIERIPAPEKPREIIYEKWLPYKPQAERPVIVERGKIYEKQPAPKNVIIEYEKPAVNIEKQVFDEGVIRADPNSYLNSSYSNAEVRIVDQITDFPGRYTPTWQQPPTTTTVTRPLTPKARPVTPKTNTLISELNKTSTSTVRGPVSYSGPWNTTYRSSYTGRGFGGYKP